MTYCTWYGSCTIQECPRHLTPVLLQEIISRNDVLVTFVAPPVCHSHWVDRQDLPDE